MIGPQDVLQMARGFFASRIILTAAELKLFEKLPADIQSLAQNNHWNTEALTMFMDVLTAIEILDKKDGIYHLRLPLEKALGNDPEASVVPMIAHLNTLWGKWSELSDIIRNGRVKDQPISISKDKDAMKPFIGAMHAIGKGMAKTLVPKLIHSAQHTPAPLKRGIKMLDIGGASGTYTIEFLNQMPELSVTLFDLPEVIPLAEERIARHGLRHRVNLVSGNFYEDVFPKGHDLVWLSAIIHQNSQKQNRELYQRCFDALESGGRIWIRDHVMNDDRTDPPAGAIFAINMLVGTAGGSTYTLAEISHDLESAGFVSPKIIHHGENMDSVVEAVKP